MDDQRAGIQVQRQVGRAFVEAVEEAQGSLAGLAQQMGAGAERGRNQGKSAWIDTHRLS